MFIACNTSSSLEISGVEYAIMAITPAVAKTLLSYQPIYDIAKKFDRQLYCLEFFSLLVSYGNTELEIGDEWVKVDKFSDVDTTKPDSSVSSATMKITSGGIIWSASPKHANGAYVETEELTWDDIAAVAKGENPFVAAGEEL